MLDRTRLSIIGAGSVRCGIPVIASLATYFGERPLEIRMYDADLERLDLFDRFARISFFVTRATHSLISTTDLSEALEMSDRVLLQVGENCARKYLKETHRMGIASLDRDAMVEQALDEISSEIPSEATILSLQRLGISLSRSHYRLEWPAEIAVDDRASIPHQVMRWVRGEEYLHELLAMNEKSPLKRWLDAPESAVYISMQSQHRID